MKKWWLTPFFLLLLVLPTYAQIGGMVGTGCIGPCREANCCGITIILNPKGIGLARDFNCEAYMQAAPQTAKQGICQQLRDKCALCADVGQYCPLSAEEKTPRNSELEAALAAFQIMAKCAERCDREYGGVIYQSLGDNKWYFTGPFAGEPHRAPPVALPSNTTARYHSHPTCRLGERFSDKDKVNAGELDARSYLLTPSNQVLMYDPQADQVFKTKRPLGGKSCTCE